jgi:hypothetical protein
MTNRSLKALLGAAFLGFQTFAFAAEPVDQDQRIRELESRIAELEMRQAASSADLAAAVDGVLRDAERRGQLMATSGDMSAGYDSGFFIRAGDAWVLRPGVMFQFRYTANWRDDVGDDGGDWENGFELRRLRFDLAGTAFTRDLTYFFQWESNREGGDTILLEAWAKYMFSADWGVRAGQFKDPVVHEFMLSVKRGLSTDTSLLDNLMGGAATGYTQAATVVYGNYAKDNPLYFEGGLTDGAGQINTNFTDRADPAPVIGASIPRHTFDFGLAGRVEYKLMGDWLSYTDFTAMGTKSRLFVVGAGGDWSQGGDGDQLVGTVDAQYETAGGLGFYTAVIARHLDAELSGRDEDTTDWGVLVQASYLIQPQWEVFGRYDVVWYDDAFALADDEDTFHEFVIGLNYYFGQNGSAGHRAKITVDLTWLPHGVPFAVPNMNALGGTEGEDEVIFKGQFQLLI